MCIMCVSACVCVCVCTCMHVRASETEFCPLSTLKPIPVYRTEATRIGALSITTAYCQPYLLVLLGGRGGLLVCCWFFVVVVVVVFII